MESEFESYDNLPNGWVYLFQVGDTAGLVCGAERSEILHGTVTFPSFYPAKGFRSGLGAGGYPSLLQLLEEPSYVEMRCCRTL